MEWYQNESRTVVLQSRVDDVQESEKIRIYHHEQHQKSIKKTAILKLETENGLRLTFNENLLCLKIFD